MFELGSYSRPATTRSTESKKYFDQGLVWAYSFNHDEAIRSFTHAASLDPEFAMAYWGIALCNGPHINFPMMLPEQSAAAWAAITRAQALKHRASALERSLIEALATRYAEVAPADRRPLDEAYAAAMRKLYLANPDDADVATLYAESLMDLLPWDLYALDGTPREQTATVLRALERAMAINPNHPGANHLYVHACEASKQPEKADKAATRLRTLVPGSGHMVHMPSHIDVRLGRWALAIEQNAKASEVDKQYRTLSPKQGFYRLYMAHDDHFRSWACMMAGRSEDSIASARKMIADIPADYLEANAMFADVYVPIAIESLMRFGKWDELLKEPQPPAFLPITTAFWYYGRATALMATGKIEEAKMEQELFRKAVAALPEGAMMVINPAAKVLSIADLTLDGEIAYKSGDKDTAIAQLTKAVAIEDELRYMEPPDWLRPARHTLGAFLYDAGKMAEAEAAYREDLRRLPENGWSLYGMGRSLRAQGKFDEAEKYEQRFKAAWKHADIELTATCLCVDGKPQ